MTIRARATALTGVGALASIPIAVVLTTGASQATVSAAEDDGAAASPAASVITLAPAAARAQRSAAQAEPRRSSARSARSSGPLLHLDFGRDRRTVRVEYAGQRERYRREANGDWVKVADSGSE